MLENLSPTRRALLGNASFIPQGITNPTYTLGLQNSASQAAVSPVIGLSNVSLPATSAGSNSSMPTAPAAVAKTSGSLLPSTTGTKSSGTGAGTLGSGGSGNASLFTPQTNGPGSTAIGTADGQTIFSNGNGTYSGMGIGDNTSPQGGYITDLGSGAFTDAQNQAYGVSGSNLFNAYAKFGLLGLFGSLLAKKIPEQVNAQEALSLVNSQNSGYDTPTSALNALQGGYEKTTMQKTLDTPGGGTLFGGAYDASGTSPIATVPTGASIAANPMGMDPAQVQQASNPALLPSFPVASVVADTPAPTPQPDVPSILPTLAPTPAPEPVVSAPAPAPAPVAAPAPAADPFAGMTWDHRYGGYVDGNGDLHYGPAPGQPGGQGISGGSGWSSSGGMNMSASDMHALAGLSGYGGGV